jgi:hypothetical protein
MARAKSQASGLRQGEATAEFSGRI